MVAMETVGCSAAVPVSGALTSAAALAGQSLTIRNTELTSSVKLSGIWTQGVSVNDVRIRSAKMHDVANGIRLKTVAGFITDLLPADIETKLYPQDTLTVEIGNTGVAETDLAFLQIVYDSLSGSDAPFSTWEQIKPRIVNLTSNEIAVTAGAAAAWSAGNFFSTGSWAPYPNTLYAVLGYECSVTEGAVVLLGTDTGNQRYGGPGSTDPEWTRDYFRRDAIESGGPRIPVINSANNGTLQTQIANVAGTGATVSWLLAQLS